jgi:hypothetical protein
MLPTSRLVRPRRAWRRPAPSTRTTSPSEGRTDHSFARTTDRDDTHGTEAHARKTRPDLRLRLSCSVSPVSRRARPADRQPSPSHAVLIVVRRNVGEFGRPWMSRGHSGWWLDGGRVLAPAWQRWGTSTTATTTWLRSARRSRVVRPSVSGRPQGADRRCAWLSQARPPVYFGVCYRRALRGGPAILKRGGAA